MARPPSVGPAATPVSSRNVGAVAMVYGSGYYDNTYAVTLLPSSLWSASYYVPLEHPFNYQSPTDLSRVMIVAQHDGTSINVGGQVFSRNRGQVLSVNVTGAAHIQSSAPVYAVYVSDVLATDPAAGVQRHYAYAHNLPSESMKVNETTVRFLPLDGNGAPVTRVVITGLSANTRVGLDINADGTVDRTETLDAGQGLYLDGTPRCGPLPKSPTLRLPSCGRGGIGGRHQSTAAAEDLPVRSSVTVSI